MRMHKACEGGQQHQRAMRHGQHTVCIPGCMPSTVDNRTAARSVTCGRPAAGGLARKQQAAHRLSQHVGDAPGVAHSKVRVGPCPGVSAREGGKGLSSARAVVSRQQIPGGRRAPPACHTGRSALPLDQGSAAQRVTWNWRGSGTTVPLRWNMARSAAMPSARTCQGKPRHCEAGTVCAKAKVQLQSGRTKPQQHASLSWPVCGTLLHACP